MGLSKFFKLAFGAIVGLGWIASSLVPGLGGLGFNLAGQRISAVLVLGMAGRLVIAVVNFRGIKTATTLHEVLGYEKIAAAVVFIMFGIFVGRSV